MKLVRNLEQTAGFGLRAAQRVAHGEILARCDAHAAFPLGYLGRAVSTLLRTGAANVGGRQHPVATTFFGRAVAMAMTTPLGNGGARYRLGRCGGGPPTRSSWGRSGATRWRRLAALTPASFETRTTNSTWRLRARGETVWFDPRLAVAYRPRDTLLDLARQYFDYGRWKRVVAQRHPASLRHAAFRQPAVGAGLAASPVLAAAGAFLGGRGGAACLRPRLGGRRAGGRHPSPGVPGGPAAAGPCHHAPELGNRFLYAGSKRFDRCRSSGEIGRGQDMALAFVTRFSLAAPADDPLLAGMRPHAAIGVRVTADRSACRCRLRPR